MRKRTLRKLHPQTRMYKELMRLISTREEWVRNMRLINNKRSRNVCTKYVCTKYVEGNYFVKNDNFNVLKNNIGTKGFEYSHRALETSSYLGQESGIYPPSVGFTDSKSDQVINKVVNKIDNKIHNQINEIENNNINNQIEVSTNQIFAQSSDSHINYENIQKPRNNTKIYLKKTVEKDSQAVDVKNDENNIYQNIENVSKSEEKEVPKETSRINFSREEPKKESKKEKNSERSENSSKWESKKDLECRKISEGKPFDYSRLNKIEQEELDKCIKHLAAPFIGCNDHSLHKKTGFISSWFRGKVSQLTAKLMLPDTFGPSSSKKDLEIGVKFALTFLINQLEKLILLKSGLPLPDETNDAKRKINEKVNGIKIKVGKMTKKDTVDNIKSDKNTSENSENFSKINCDKSDTNTSETSENLNSKQSMTTQDIEENISACLETALKDRFLSLIDTLCYFGYTMEISDCTVKSAEISDLKFIFGAERGRPLYEKSLLPLLDQHFVLSQDASLIFPVIGIGMPRHLLSKEEIIRKLQNKEKSSEYISEFLGHTKPAEETDKPMKNEKCDKKDDEINSKNNEINSKNDTNNINRVGDLNSRVEMRNDIWIDDFYTKTYKKNLRNNVLKTDEKTDSQVSDSTLNNYDKKYNTKLNREPKKMRDVMNYLNDSLKNNAIVRFAATCIVNQKMVIKNNNKNINKNDNNIILGNEKNEDYKYYLKFEMPVLPTDEFLTGSTPPLFTSSKWKMADFNYELGGNYPINSQFLGNTYTGIGKLYTFNNQNRTNNQNNHDD